MIEPPADQPDESVRQTLPRVGEATTEQADTSPLLTERGRTSLAPRVVEKIAGRAAAEVPGVQGVAASGLRRLLQPFGSDSADRAVAQADVGRATTAIDVAVRVRYPLPVTRLADSVRRHVSARVEELTGLHVTEVNVTVPEFTLEDERPSIRVQ